MPGMTEHGPSGVSAASLVAKARANEGGWAARSFVGRGFTDYATQVVGALAQRGMGADCNDQCQAREL
jgi:hypothetical protein